MKATRLIAVRFLPTTATKGTRLKVSMVGHGSRVYGYHSFSGCTRAEVEAAQLYFETVYKTVNPEATDVVYTAIANPANDDALILVQYHGNR